MEERMFRRGMAWNKGQAVHDVPLYLLPCTVGVSFLCSEFRYAFYDSYCKPPS